MDSKAEQLHLRAQSLVAEFEQGGGTNYIDEAVALDREVLELCPPGHPKRPFPLTQLAIHLWKRYNQLGGMVDLEEAIILDRELLELCPPGHPGRSTPLNNLGVHLSTRYEQLGEMEDLNEAIVLNRDALVHSPPGHPGRPMFLNNLALRHSTRYEQLGDMEDLNKAIILVQHALAVCPPGNPDRSMFMNNLAVHLSTRYNQLGAMEDLDKAIVLDRDTLVLRPPGHPLQSRSLSNLAGHLFTRYQQLGALEDLNEAIFFGRDALAHFPPGHPDRSTSLNNVATYLQMRYYQFRAMEDLNETTVLYRDALALRPPGHPLRSTSLNNLAAHLCASYGRLGVTEDLNEAISLSRDALVLRPPGHPDRSASLSGLANQLFTRYKQVGEMEDLNETIVLDRDALEPLPLWHPIRSTSLSGLADHLFTRYTQLGAMEDLNEAIVVGRDALARRPPGHPNRAQSLDNLACYLHTRFTRLHQSTDKEVVFSLYTQLAHVGQMVSSADLSAARAWIGVAEDFQHPTTLVAYETSLRLLTHHLATLPSLPQHLSVLKNFTSSLAVDAFSACLRNRSPTKAVELLEQGRGVFWNQLSCLRSPLDDVIASGPTGTTLADEFTQTTSHVRHALDSPGADQHDRVWRLNLELRGVVTRIRELPGLSHFLLPLLFSDLQHAAIGGPVIIVNASKYSCDALVVLGDRDPVHIPLSITKEHVRELSSKLRTLTVRAGLMNVTKDIGFILRELWDEVVSHIVSFLQTIYPCQSRIWWCPTAEFSLLPLHAAGPYRRGQQNLGDLYISSYTPTLTALIRARRHDPSNFAAKGKRFVAIGQAKPIREIELDCVGTELVNIGQHIDGLATFTCIEGPESNIARVSEELGMNEWVHLACHGLPNQKQPFESAFALHDGHFTIERIIRCNLENPEFAYLSACHTTVGDEESPDEVIHLASAMQFAGFRSVIGTMWAVDDGQANKITSMFYAKMKDASGRLDHTRAAFALNKTMKTLADVPLDQRILYIHLGA